MKQPEIRFSTRHLRLIDAIARDGSLAAAAVSLNMTQSAVTKSLQDAEGLAGVVLFVRTSRGAVPTPYGELLVGHARDVIARLRRASREIADLKGGTGGTIAVGTLPSAASSLLPEALSRVLAERPRLRATITEGRHERLTSLLRRGDLDLVVGRLPPRRRPPDLVECVLGADRAQVVVRVDHALARASAKGLTLAALQDARWILPPPDTTMRRQLDAAFHDAGLAPPVPAIESLTFLTNRALLLADDYVTIWPRQLASVEARRGQVVTLPLELPATDRPLGMWWRADVPLSPAAQALADALKRGATASADGALSHDPAQPNQEEAAPFRYRAPPDPE